MTKFRDISFGVLITLIIVAAIEIFLVNRHYEEESKKKPPIDSHDEYLRIKKHIERHAMESKNKPVTVQQLYRSAKSGFLRGGILGLITFGIEGALAGGLLLGVVNPIVLGIEHAL